MKSRFYIVFLLMPLFVWSQADKKPSLNDFKRQVNYGKSSDYKGPKVNRSEQPADFEKVNENDNSGEGGNGLSYSDEDVRRARKKNKQESTGNSGSGGGTGMNEPPISQRNIPDYDEPDLPNPDVSVGLSPFWAKFILIVILAIAGLFLIYYIVKNRRKKDRVQEVDESELELTHIELSELELRLQKAFQEQDYRTCIRIYFTFILKELIRLRQINWKKDKTNYDYIQELNAEKHRIEFSKFVSIFDLVWYGEYPLNLEEYQRIEKEFKVYYNTLNQQHA